MTYEGLRLKIRYYRRKWLASYRKKQLKCEDFTIISNNCWGGMIYESYNLKKNSPTIGCFFMADDYIKFLSDLKNYMQLQLCFIEHNQSKWKDFFKNDAQFGQFPIGLLGDIEIFFLHYKTEKEAEDKWTRRKQRINWNKLIVKFNDQNGCKKEHLVQFEKLPFKNKVCFTIKEYPELKSIIAIPAPKSHKYIRASYEPFGKSKYMNITEFINNIDLERENKQGNSGGTE